MPPPATYARWSVETFPENTLPGDREPEAAPNSAGLLNLFSYAFDLNPLDPDLSLLPGGGVDNGDLWIRFRRRKDIADYLYIPQTATNLPASDWEDEILSPELIDGSDPVVDIVEIRRPIGAEDPILFLRIFLRLP